MRRESRTVPPPSGLEAVRRRDPELGEVLRDVYDHLFLPSEPSELVSTVTSIGHRLVDRGDPAAADWTEATLTADGNWRDLDCSSIVPYTAIAVIFVGVIHYGELWLRKNGNTNEINAGRLIDRNPDLDEDLAADMIVFCDDDRVVEYKLTEGTGGGTLTLDLAVKGWWL